MKISEHVAVGQGEADYAAREAWRKCVAGFVTQVT
jgi:hypothetical protein